MNKETMECGIRNNYSRQHQKVNIYNNVYQETTGKFQGFWSLMGVWRGSVTKLIWHDLLLFIFLYGMLSVLYRCILFQYHTSRETFELICVFCSRYCDMIPITFLTGFYVSQVVTRYWDQFMSLQWPDKIAMKIAIFIPGKSKFHRNLRRNIVRYLNLSTVLVFRLVSQKAKHRFPSLESLVKCDLLHKNELNLLETIDQKTPHETTWVPIVWALKLIQRHRTAGRITIEAPVYASLVGCFDDLETRNRKILNYGWVHFPLAYTQVANLSVFLYFFASLFGRQYLVLREQDNETNIFPHLGNSTSFAKNKPFEKHTPDFFFPLFTVIEFICYMGWLKVAETLLNPFGDDDDDFQINYIIDRNLQVCYMIVDDQDIDRIEDEDDPYGDLLPEGELPYRDPNNKDIASKLIDHNITHYGTPTSIRRVVDNVRKSSISFFSNSIPGTSPKLDSNKAEYCSGSTSRRESTKRKKEATNSSNIINKTDGMISYINPAAIEIDETLNNSKL